MDNMNDRGILFMWWLDRNKPEDMEAAIRHAGGEANAWPIWANGLFGRALTGYYLASADKKALRALELAYGGDLCWTRKEVMPTNVWSAFETYTWSGNETISTALTEFFEIYKIEPPADRSVRMIDTWYNRPPDEKRPWFKQPNHGVFFNESTIPWAVGYLWTGDRAYLEAPLKWYDIIECGDDGMQPQGVPVSDENSGPTGSLRGSETCSVAGFIWSQITLLRVSGEGRLADRVERAVFNAGPAVASRDCKTHVYHQTPNRINATAYGSPAYLYQKTQSPLCCTAAQNRILPNYLAHLWMATYDNGLAAVHYGPCKVTALAADRVPVELDCRTDYPFNETIEVAVKPARGRISAFVPHPRLVCESGNHAEWNSLQRNRRRPRLRAHRTGVEGRGPRPPAIPHDPPRENGARQQRRGYALRHGFLWPAPLRPPHPRYHGCQHTRRDRQVELRAGRAG